MFEIHLGVPEMEELWNNLQKRHQDGTATKKEEKLRRQMGKAMALLSGNPRHPGLHSHEISSLRKSGNRIWKTIRRRQAEFSGAMVPEKATSQLLDLNRIRKINPTHTGR